MPGFPYGFEELTAAKAAFHGRLVQNELFVEIVRLRLAEHADLEYLTEPTVDLRKSPEVYIGTLVTPRIDVGRVSSVQVPIAIEHRDQCKVSPRKVIFNQIVEVRGCDETTAGAEFKILLADWYDALKLMKQELPGQRIYLNPYTHLAAVPESV